MMVGNFIVDYTKYEYLNPLWPILEKHPLGISLNEAIKKSGLNKQKMLKYIEKLSIEYNKCSSKLMNKGFLTTIIQSAMNGEKTDETLAEDMATSWIFDKVMLYNRINELHWTDHVNNTDLLKEIIEKWKEHKGI